MDIVRIRRRSAPARLATPAALAALVAAALYGGFILIHPRPSEPVIDRHTLVTDTAVRSDLVRSVRASGTFVAERIQIAAAPADGTIAAIPIRVGSSVRPDTVVARLTDPDLDAAVIDVQAQLAAARAELRSVEAETRAAQLDRSGAIDSAVADYRQVHELAVRYTALHAQGLVSDYDTSVAQIKAGAARETVDIDRRKVAVDAADAAAKAAVARARIAELAAALTAKEAQHAALAVRAGASGIVESISVERGARITAGTQIARIVGQHDLKATLEVPESDIRDVVPGLPAAIDAPNGIVPGHVVRVDPSAQNGAIAVDVAIDGSAPSNARPDLHIDGTIALERLHDVVSIERPANAADDTTIDLYRLTDGGTRAVRTRVKLGRGSLERVAVRSGIAPGTTVITSDTSAYTDAALRVK